MSTWNDQPAWMQTKKDGTKMTCQICGNTPDAIWSGNDFTVVCFHCAFKIFPKLMADAVANRMLHHPINKYLQMSAFKAMWSNAAKHYWLALASELLQTIKKEDANHDNN